MQHGHCTGLNPSLEPIPHHQVVAFVQLVHEIGQLRKIVAVVRVAHNDVLSIRCRNASAQGASVPRVGIDTTRAPSFVAISCDPSVLPLSAITTSPRMPSFSILPRAFLTQVPSVRLSLRQGITTESCNWDGTCASLMAPVGASRAAPLASTLPSLSRRAKSSSSFRHPDFHQR